MMGQRQELGKPYSTWIANILRNKLQSAYEENRLSDDKPITIEDKFMDIHLPREDIRQLSGQFT